MYISHIGNKISYKKTKKNMYKLFKSNNPLYMNFVNLQDMILHELYASRLTGL